MHELLAQPAAETYRKIIASAVPVATMNPNTPSASKSERSSVMVVTSLRLKIAPIRDFVKLGNTLAEWLVQPQIKSLDVSKQSRDR